MHSILLVIDRPSAELLTDPAVRKQWATLVQTVKDSTALKKGIRLHAENVIMIEVDHAWPILFDLVSKARELEFSTSTLFLAEEPRWLKTSYQ